MWEKPSPLTKNSEILFSCLKQYSLIFRKIYNKKNKEINNIKMHLKRII